MWPFDAWHRYQLRKKQILQKKERDVLEADRKKAEDALAKHINLPYEMIKKHLIEAVEKAKRNEAEYDQKIGKLSGSRKKHLLDK